MEKIILVSCVSRKNLGQAPAEDLYCSTWFTKAKTYVKAHADKWYILSAKYGLLEPSQIISTYNTSLNSMRVNERIEWAKQVLNTIKIRIKKEDQIEIFAGQRYREFLINPLLSFGYNVKAPLEHLGIGKQMQWFDERNK